MKMDRGSDSYIILGSHLRKRNTDTVRVRYRRRRGNIGGSGGPVPGRLGRGVAQALGGRILSFLFFLPLPSCRPPPVERGHKAKKIKIILDPQPKKSTVFHHNPHTQACRSLPAVHLEAALLRFLPSLPSFTSLSRSRPHLFLFFGQPQVGNNLPPKINCLSAIPIFLPSSHSPAEHGTQQSIISRSEYCIIYVII